MESYRESCKYFRINSFLSSHFQGEDGNCSSLVSVNLQKFSSFYHCKNRQQTVKVITEPFTTVPYLELTNQLEAGKSCRCQRGENV